MGEAGAPTPSTAAQTLVMAKYAFLNYFRARRFLVMVLLVTIINLALTAAVAYTRSQAFLNSPLGFYGAWFGSFISVFGLLTVVFFGGDAISGEFQNKTGYYLAPNPVRRSAIYVGKFLAAFVASTIILVLFAAFTLANGLYYNMGVPTQFAESFLFAWIGITAALSVTFMFSSLFKSSSISILMTVLLFLFVFNVIDTLVTVLLKLEPWYSISYALGIIGNVLIVPFPQHFVPAATLGPAARFAIPTYNATIPEGLIIMAAYFIFSALVGTYLFERKEFT